MAVTRRQFLQWLGCLFGVIYLPIIDNRKRHGTKWDQSVWQDENTKCLDGLVWQ